MAAILDLLAAEAEIIIDKATETDQSEMDTSLALRLFHILKLATPMLRQTRKIKKKWTITMKNRRNRLTSAI